MPTAVLQLDIDRLPDTLVIAQQYEQALILVRRRGAPVGQFYVPVCSGSVDMDTFRRAVLDVRRRQSWQWELDDYLESGAAPALRPAATVAVCTRERPDDLVVALQAISALEPGPLDILVVDNNPATSRTQDVVAKFPNVRYVREDRPGLDAARNRALLEATTPVVAFSDDDAAPEPEWLGYLLQPFADPQVLCTSGLTLALELETPAQEWFERYSPFGRGFDRTVFDGIHHDPLEVSLIGAGANMALRRSVIDRVGRFDEALDAGTATRSGGDHEMFGRILAAGYRIVYEPRAVSWHRHRRTWDDLRATLNGYGRGVYAVWTRRLLYERHPGVLRHAFRWLHRSQLPRLWRSLRHEVDSMPLDLVLAELRGCVAGPSAYCKARRQLRSTEAL